MKLWTHDAFREHKFPKPIWVVRPLFQRGSTNLLQGEPESGKTAFAMTLAEAVASGEPLFGEFVTVQRGTVVIIELDMGAQQYRHRWPNALFARTEDLPLYHITTDNPINIAGTHKYKPLQEAADLDPTLVIVDALIDTHDLDENKAETVKRVLGGFRSYFPRACRVFIHHNAKESSVVARSPMSRVRGHGGWAGSASTVLEFTRKLKAPEWTTTMTFTKGRDTPDWMKRPRKLALDVATMTLHFAEPTMEQRARAHALKAKGKMEPGELVGFLQGCDDGLSRSAAYRLAQDVLEAIQNDDNLNQDKHLRLIDSRK